MPPRTPGNKGPPKTWACSMSAMSAWSCTHRWSTVSMSPSITLTAYGTWQGRKCDCGCVHVCLCVWQGSVDGGRRRGTDLGPEVPLIQVTDDAGAGVEGQAHAAVVPEGLDTHGEERVDVHGDQLPPKVVREGLRAAAGRGARVSEGACVGVWVTLQKGVAQREGWDPLVLYRAVTMSPENLHTTMIWTARRTEQTREQANQAVCLDARAGKVTRHSTLQ